MELIDWYVTKDRRGGHLKFLRLVKFSGTPWSRLSTNVPLPQMEEQLLVDAFAPRDIQVPEQVIEVPKILIEELSVRTPVREPQLAEQLVEAPSIVSLIDVIRQPVEQIVDIPVPRGGVRRLRGFHPEQGSTALPIEQIVDGPQLVAFMSLAGLGAVGYGTDGSTVVTGSTVVRLFSGC